MSDFTDGNIFVDYQPVENSAEDMRMQTKAIKDTIESLNQELNELQKTWVGDDKDVYHEKQNQWNGAVDSMGNILTAHSQLLNEVSDAYRKKEQGLASDWQAI